MASKIRRLYEFDAFVLDPAENQLRHDGMNVPLTAKSFETLLALVERSGHLVEKEELIGLVWPDTVVEEANLARCIHTLRKALREDETGFRHIETVPKRGYRFIADVRVIEEIGPIVKPETAADNPIPPVATRMFALSLAILLLLGTAGAYLYFNRAHSDAAVGMPIKSIAVLPLENVSKDQQLEYLSDGITESLISNLSQLSGLKVIARGSTFRYKGKDVEPKQVARQLGVEGLITGKLVKVGDRLKMSLELMDVRDGRHVWGVQFDLAESELVSTERVLSREIADQLRVKLTTSQGQHFPGRETVNLQAYELLLKGRFHWNLGGTENRKKAVEFIRQSIASDPQYAPAYAELSSKYSHLVSISVLDAEEFMPKAEEAARKALKLDEGLAEAHLAVARVYLARWNWQTAEQELRRAIALNPNLAQARSLYSFYLSLQGQHDAAIAEAKRAIDLDPITPTMNLIVGFRLLLARRYDEALEATKKTFESFPDLPQVHAQFGYIYSAMGRYSQAITGYEKSIELGDESADTQVYLGVAYAKAGNTSQARGILKRLESSKEYVSPGVLASLYVALGERNKAFAALEKAYLARDLQLQALRVDPTFDPLRSDPRFVDLLRRVNLG